MNSILNSALRQSHWLIRRNPPERSSPMVTVGILAILIVFSIGILLSPKKKSEPKRVILIEAQGQIETVEIKKVDEVIIR